jgi:hypothetical protein
MVENEKIFVINILSFLTATSYDQNDYYDYDLREPTSNIVRPNRVPTDKRVITTDDWKNIGYYPSQQDKRRMVERIINQQNRPPQNRNAQMQNRGIRPHPPQNVNIFSAEYARYIGARPKATASANIRLGGVRR